MTHLFWSECERFHSDAVPLSAIHLFAVLFPIQYNSRHPKSSIQNIALFFSTLDTIVETLSIYAPLSKQFISMK